jgi:hypothetical protein
MLNHSRADLEFIFQADRPEFYRKVGRGVLTAPVSNVAGPKGAVIVSPDRQTRSASF